MRYKVIGIYKHEEIVDTDSFSYGHWRESWRGKHYRTEEEAVMHFVQDFLNYQIIDDDGHGTLSASSLEWTIEKEA